MTLRKQIEDIFKQYWVDHVGLDDYGCGECEKYVDLICTAFKEYVDGKRLPVEKEVDYRMTFIMGNNMLIDEIKGEL